VQHADVGRGARRQRPRARPSKQLRVVRIEAEDDHPGRVGHARHYRWWRTARVDVTEGLLPTPDPVTHST
jgi:hypothetical protein